LKIYINQNSKNRKKIRIKFKKKLKEFARDLIESDVKKICSREKISFNKIAIREQKTRWGSCSSQKNLNFNWKIILAPKSVYRYVLVHEISHLIEHNHSPAFWDLVKKLHPNYENDKHWLKENSTKLEVI
jgi:hypothetical protein